MNRGMTRRKEHATPKATRLQNMPCTCPASVHAPPQLTVGWRPLGGGGGGAQQGIACAEAGHPPHEWSPTSSGCLTTFDTESKIRGLLGPGGGGGGGLPYLHAYCSPYLAIALWTCPLLSTPPLAACTSLLSHRFFCFYVGYFSFATEEPRGSLFVCMCRDRRKEVNNHSTMPPSLRPPSTAV